MSNTDTESTVHGQSREIGEATPTLLEATTTTAGSTHKRKMPKRRRSWTRVLTHGSNQKQGRDHNTTQRRHTPSSVTQNGPIQQTAHRVPTVAALSAQLRKSVNEQKESKQQIAKERIKSTNQRSLRIIERHKVKQLATLLLQSRRKCRSLDKALSASIPKPSDQILMSQNASMTDHIGSLEIEKEVSKS